MSKRTLVMALVIVVVFGVGTALCGAAGPEKVKLVYYSREWIPQAVDSINDAIARFQEDYPYVDVEIIAGSTGGSREFLITSAASGTFPDLFDGHVRFGIEFGTAGFFRDLSDGIDEDFVPIALEGAQWDGKTYMFPHTFEPHVIYYDVKALQEAGLEPASPGQWWSWDDFAVAARKLTKSSEGDGHVDRRGFGLAVSEGQTLYKYVSSWFFSAGDGIVAQNNGKWEMDFGEGAVRTLNWFQGLFEEGLISTETLVAYPLAEFVEGNCAMFMTGTYPRGLAEFQGIEWGDDWGMMPLPVHTETKISVPGTMGVAVSARTAYPEEAMALALELTGTKNLNIWNKAGSWLPARFSAMDDPYFSQDKDGWSMIHELATEYDYFRNVPNHPIIPQWYDEYLKPMFDSVVLGRAEATDAVAKAKKAGDMLIAEYEMFRK